MGLRLYFGWTAGSLVVVAVEILVVSVLVELNLVGPVGILVVVFVDFVAEIAPTTGK